MVTLTKKDIAKRLQERERYKDKTLSELQIFITDFLEEVKKAVLEDGYSVTFRNFGKFYRKTFLRKVAPSKDGKVRKLNIPSKYTVLRFSYSKKKARINEFVDLNEVD